MDTLKKLINNPGMQHVAEIVIGHLDKDFARKLAGPLGYRELFTGGELDFLMKTLRKPMYNEAKKICEEKREFTDKRRHHYKMSIFDMFPFWTDFKFLCLRLFFMCMTGF